MRLKAVILCALSAHTRPRTTMRSHLVRLEARAAYRSARNRATFSCGVSCRGIEDTLEGDDGGGFGEREETGAERTEVGLE